jgi:hypothetical protein
MQVTVGNHDTILLCHVTRVRLPADETSTKCLWSPWSAVGNWPE